MNHPAFPAASVLHDLFEQHEGVPVTDWPANLHRKVSSLFAEIEEHVDVEHKRFVTRRRPCNQMKHVVAGVLSDLSEDDPWDDRPAIDMGDPAFAELLARSQALAAREHREALRREIRIIEKREWSFRCGADLVTMDAVLKEYYSNDKLTSLAAQPNSTFKMIQKTLSPDSDEIMMRFRSYVHVSQPGYNGVIKID